MQGLFSGVDKILWQHEVVTCIVVGKNYKKVNLKPDKTKPNHALRSKPSQILHLLTIKETMVRISNLTKPQKNYKNEFNYFIKIAM